MPLTQLHVVSIPVSDQDRAGAFYRDVLGFEPIEDAPMGPDRGWVQLGPKGAQTSITLVTWFETMRPGSLDGLVVHTNNIGADHAEFTRKGLELTPIESAFLGPLCHLRRPGRTRLGAPGHASLNAVLPLLPPP